MTKTTHFLFAHLINAALLLFTVSQTNRRLSLPLGQIKNPPRLALCPDRHSIERLGSSSVQTPNRTLGLVIVRQPNPIVSLAPWPDDPTTPDQQTRIHTTIPQSHPLIRRSPEDFYCRGVETCYTISRAMIGGYGSLVIRSNFPITAVKRSTYSNTSSWSLYGGSGDPDIPH